MANDDIKRKSVEELPWDDADRAASLAVVYQHALDCAIEAEDWYKQERKSKRLWGRGLRSSAIVLGAVAAVMPVLSELSGSGIQPGWSTVALAVGAGLVGLDRYFGFSTAWMRFMVTAQRIAELRHRFESAWQLAQSKAANPPSDEELATFLALAHGLEKAVDGEIDLETKAWVTEFDSALEWSNGEAVAQKNRKKAEQAPAA